MSSSDASYASSSDSEVAETEVEYDLKDSNQSFFKPKKFFGVIGTLKHRWNISLELCQTSRTYLND